MGEGGLAKLTVERATPNFCSDKSEIKMDGDINLCGICKSTVNQSDESMKCDGTCLKKFHVKCLKFSPSFLKQFKECKNLLFNCDECVSNPIASMSETVKKMLSYLQIIEERIKRHDTEFKCTYESIKLLHEEMSENKRLLRDEIEKVVKNSDKKQSNLIKKSVPMVVVHKKRVRRVLLQNQS